MEVSGEERGAMAGKIEVSIYDSDKFLIVNSLLKTVPVSAEVTGIMIRKKYLQSRLNFVYRKRHKKKKD